MLKQERFQKLISEAEATLPISEWKLAKENIWPLVRFAIGFKNFGLEMTNEPKRTSVHRLYYWFHAIMGAIFPLLVFCVRLLIQKKKIVLTHSFSQYVVQTDVGLFNRFMDSFALKYRESSFAFFPLEIAQSGLKSGGRYQSTLLLDLLISIHIRLHQKRPAVLEMPGYHHLLELGRKYQLSMPSESDMRSVIICMETRRCFYERILSWISPQMVLTSVYYSQNSAPLVWACRRKKIPVFDVQHGVINHLHFGYMPWAPSLAKDNLFLPNDVLVWSDVEKRYFSSWSLSQMGGIHFGNLWLEVWRQTKSSPLARSAFGVHGKNLVLYTLQTDVIPAELFTFIRETASHWFWLVRAHPRQMHMLAHFTALLEAEGLKGQFEIELSSKATLPEVLGVIDLHVTENSTVAIEAYHFGVKTIFTDSLGVEYFHNLVPENFTGHYDGQRSFPEFLNDFSSQERLKAAQENTAKEPFPLDSLLRMR